MARRYRRCSSNNNLESLLKAEKERMQFKSDFNNEYDRMQSEARVKVEGLKQISLEDASIEVLNGKHIVVLKGLTVGELKVTDKYVQHMEYDEESSSARIRDGKCDLSDLSDSSEMEFYLA